MKLSKLGQLGVIIRTYAEILEKWGIYMLDLLPRFGTFDVSYQRNSKADWCAVHFEGSRYYELGVASAGRWMLQPRWQILPDSEVGQHTLA